ncbi:MAG: P-II family nitrogen regulator [Betaproteobacteria bacterium]|nr:P-II family nitrogen regulator [Betaproteobacteria bacterium]
MKEIKAYVHSNRIADVIAAIEESGLMSSATLLGVRNINATSVQSLLKPVDSAEQRYSLQLGEAVIDEVRLELLCEDDQVEPLVALIDRTARTGQRIAGWILVIDVSKAVVIGGPHV